MNVSARCGLSSKARQIRPIVDFDKPLRSAIAARDQCVAFVGVDSNVATTTSSTWSTVIVGGRPGRGSSTRPARRSATNRRRHLFTVFGATPRSAATRVFNAPGAAQANTIRDRSAKPAADFRRRDHRSNCSRSASLNTSEAFGRPVLAIDQAYNFQYELMAQYTSVALAKLFNF